MSLTHSLTKLVNPMYEFSDTEKNMLNEILTYFGIYNTYDSKIILDCVNKLGTMDGVNPIYKGTFVNYWKNSVIFNESSDEIMAEKIVKPVINPDIEQLPKEANDSLESDELNLEQEGKKFRFQNQHVMLTYKTHLNKVVFESWLRSSCPKMKIPFIRCAHETGDPKMPYLHTHVVVDFGAKFDTQNVRYFDFNGVHPQIKRLATREHQQNARRYLAKEDPANADLATYKNSVALNIWDCNTVQDALEQFMTKPSDAPGIIAAYSVKTDQTVLKSDFQPKPWHEKLEFWIHQQTNRKVYWIYDPVGQSGKTDWTRHKMITESDKIAFLKSVGKVADASLNLVEKWNSGWRGNTIIYDMPRTLSDRESIFEFIECCKDGMFTSGKYKSCSVPTHYMHVVVLANFLPMMKGRNGQDTLSLDRWSIWEMTPEKDIVDITTKCLHGYRGHGIEIEQGKFNPMSDSC